MVHEALGDAQGSEIAMNQQHVDVTPGSRSLNPAIREK
jgi:hypothetical protein